MDTKTSVEVIFSLLLKRLYNGEGFDRNLIFFFLNPSTDILLWYDPNTTEEDTQTLYDLFIGAYPPKTLQQHDEIGELIRYAVRYVPPSLYPVLEDLVMKNSELTKNFGTDTIPLLDLKESISKVPERGLTLSELLPATRKDIP